MFTKLQEILTTLNTNVKDVKKKKKANIELLEKRTVTSEMKKSTVWD